ncbi:MAG: D-alanyl-D-alanine carboxypeptidase DacB precursor [Syntrophorhabdaceae bacterium PtaU1.Bin034]|nr:MAG: D-alanyl-D-alanine carboxypeptidase DacB precursor [Syntrophorhabdaceae bacterium PtaU1.Bin034]
MIYKGTMRRLLFLLLVLFPFSVLASEITADSYLLVEKDSFNVIAGKDYHRALPPASTTKVLTTILALERLDDHESIVPTKKVLSIPASKLSLHPGRPYKAIDLIKGAMVESANDAAYSLAVAIGGSEEEFARMMNEKAREIGARDSNFENASGLYLPGHRSSAYDLALIFRYALQNKKFEEIVGTKYFLFNRGNADVKYMNHNRLLFCFAPSIGGKTGFTRVSRHCYVGAFEKEGKVYILSLLGSRNLWGDAVNILQNIYTDVPSKKEISLARASRITLSPEGPLPTIVKTSKVKLSSYKIKKEKKPEIKKKLKKAKKAKRKPRRV